MNFPAATLEGAGRIRNYERVPSSFRDPSGFVFTCDGCVYRQVNRTYEPHYTKLMASGLYQKLVEAGLLVRHEEACRIEPPEPKAAFKILKPEQIETVSYPYEWSFSQLKDAALTTLEIQRLSLDFGMSLKDCTSFNIQFVGTQPVFIDTLSFEKYEPGNPWVAYRQFCEHFLAPLALMANSDVRLGKLLEVYINGLPLDLVSKILPARSKLSFGLLTHIYLHAKAQRRYAAQSVSRRGSKFSLRAFRGLIENLISTVEKLKWRPAKTEWSDYYTETNYSDKAAQHKAAILERYLDQIRPHSVWDLGANTGRFSRLAAKRGIPTVAFDIDPAAVEKNYRECRRSGQKHLLPLLMDLANPSPQIGWNNCERESMIGRGPADAVMALALVHHLAISNNVPLRRIAEFLGRIGSWLMIEFVPKSDSQVKRLLASREDIFSAYTEPGFREAFGAVFSIEDAQKIDASERTLYLMRSRQQ